jgi:type IV secretory pathway VirB10-like protein
MEIGRTTVGIVALSCLTAGGAAAYLATRPVSPATADSVAVGVEQSEGLVEAPAPPTPVASEAPSRPTPRPAATPVAAPPRPATASRQTVQAPATPVAIPAEGRAAVEAPREPALTAPAPVAPAEAPLASAEPPEPRFEDLVIATDSVLGLQMDTSLTSERAQVEDLVVAHVTRDVRVGDRVVIPAGSKANGEVTMVDRGGKLKEKARLAVRFTSVVLADGTRVPIETDTIFREGDGPGGESAAKIGGGAIGGAILGGIFGGGKGAAIGSAVGAGAGTAAVMAGGRNPATLPAGTPVTIRLVKPATVTVDLP